MQDPGCGKKKNCYHSPGDSDDLNYPVAQYAPSAETELVIEMGSFQFNDAQQLYSYTQHAQFCLFLVYRVDREQKLQLYIDITNFVQ